MHQLINLSQKQILVTGASSGIGREIALVLDKLDTNLILCGRNKERLEETKSQLSPNTKIECFDFNNTSDINKWMQKITLQYGPLDGLVHSAGISELMPLKFLNEKTIREVLSVNLESTILLTKSLTRKKVCTSPASVVLISSVMGLVGSIGRTAYSASKSAIIGFCRSAALELAPEKIRINCIAPGFVKTEMFEEVKKKLNQKQIDEIVSAHPLGLGEATDVAHAAAFLLADSAKWITGSTLVVDGGYTIK